MSEIQRWHKSICDCFNFPKRAISEHSSTKLSLKACYLEDEKKAKEL